MTSHFTCAVCKNTFEGGKTRKICKDCNTIPRYCICGCSTQLKSIYHDSKFTSGHNVYFESKEVISARGLKGKIVQMQGDNRTHQFTCRECGETSQGDVTRRTCAKCQSAERPCKCGCGEVAKATPFRNAQYKTGHYTRTLSFEEQKRRNAKRLAKRKYLPPTLETRKKLSESMFKRHKEGNFKASHTMRHSKGERSLKPYLEPLGYIHSEDKSLRISSGFRTRYPDYYNSTTKQIVEYFGTYWHRDRVLPKGKKHATEQEVINWYQKQGWSCTVIWENEVPEMIEHFQDIAVGVL